MEARDFFLTKSFGRGVPVVKALLGKGAALGTTLALMMRVIALSPPEMIILSRILKPQPIVVFIVVVGCRIVFVGFHFNSQSVEERCQYN